MTPYRELRDGRPLVPDPTEPHQSTLDDNSFDFLVREGLAEEITTYVMRCPGAWGCGFSGRVKERIKNLIRPFLGKPGWRDNRQIIYDIRIKAQDIST